MARDFSAKNVIVGAGQLLVTPTSSLVTTLPTLINKTKTAQTPDNIDSTAAGNTWLPVGYTQDGATITIEPTYGEVPVDQLLDAAKIFKSGTNVKVTTSLSEATLENLILVLSGYGGDFYTGSATGFAATTYSGVVGASTTTVPSYYGANGAASATYSDVLSAPVDASGGLTSAIVQPKYAAFGGTLTGYAVNIFNQGTAAGQLNTASFKSGSLIVVFGTGTRLDVSYPLSAWQRVTISGLTTLDTALSAASFNSTFLVIGTDVSASAASLVSLVTGGQFTTTGANGASAVCTNASVTWQDATVQNQIANALNINGGALGAFPVERSICLIGAGPTPATNKSSDRFYIGYRATSMESVSIAVKRDDATTFPVTFRLMPYDGQGGADGNALYGRVVDRIY